MVWHMRESQRFGHARAHARYRDHHSLLSAILGSCSITPQVKSLICGSCLDLVLNTSLCPSKAQESLRPIIAEVDGVSYAMRRPLRCLGTDDV